MNFSLLRSTGPSYAEVFLSALKKRDFDAVLYTAKSRLTSIEIKEVLTGDYPIDFKKKILQIFIQRPVRNASEYNDFVSNSLDFLPDLWKEILNGNDCLRESLAELHRKILFMAKRNKTKALLHSFLDIFEEYHPEIEGETGPEDFGLGKDLRSIIACGRHPYLFSFFLGEKKDLTTQVSAQILA